MSKRAAALAESIRHQILSALDTGLWSRGDRLPSTREMGHQLDVDPRLVTQAYRQLALEGIIELRERSGAFISGSSAPLRGAPNGLSEHWIVQLLSETVLRETPAPLLSEWVRRATETVRLRAFVLAPTVDQVAGLKRELALFYGLETAGATMETLAAGGRPLELRQADLIVAVASSHDAALLIAGETGARVVCVDVRRDIVGPAVRRLMQLPTFLVVADERFGHVLAEYLVAEAGPDGARAAVLVAGGDDLGVIPESAIVYVTQAARETLGDRPLKGSVLPQVQVIAPASSTELLQFIVAANLAATRAKDALTNASA